MFGIQRLSNFGRLPYRKQWLFIQTFTCLTLVRLGLRFLPFQVLRQRLWISIPPQQQPQHAAISLTWIIWAVQTSTRYMPGGAKCLARALTMQRLMRSYGYEPIFRIGVTKSEMGTFEAHAWIEYEGNVVMGQLENLEQFIVLPLEQEPQC